jgi:hypothetical protein
MVISENDIEKALHYLVNTADKAAAARANRIVVEEYRKVIKSEIMKRYAAMPIGAQEREAYADPAYREHIEAIREAVHKDESYRFLREAAGAKIEAWRSQQANARAQRI